MSLLHTYLLIPFSKIFSFLDYLYRLIIPYINVLVREFFIQICINIQSHKIFESSLKVKSEAIPSDENMPNTRKCCLLLTFK